MIGNHFSLILLPTNKCNVACEYCFEDKTSDFMSLDQLSILIEKVLDHMEACAIPAMTIYWQGGEIMLLPPNWLERANEIIGRAAERRGKRVEHSLQSNLIGYSGKWKRVIAEMFGNSVGASMDYPNLYRKARNGAPEEYTAIWTRNARAARDAGIHLGVISIPNKGTLEAGAEKFYSYFVDELEIDDVSFTDLLQKSEARERFQARPEALMEHETCLGCEYLSICHGGCPVRTYSITGDFFVKDPYCQVYKAIFSTMEEIAAKTASARRGRSLPVLRMR